MIDYSEIEWEVELLDGMLRPRPWHGQDVIWPGQARTRGDITVRGAFEDVRRRILFLIEDNKRLFDNETQALDRMKRAEHNANLALARVRDREAEIGRLREALAVYADDDNWLAGEWMGNDDPQEIARKALRLSTAPTRPADVSTNAQNVGMSADGQTERSEA